MEKDEVTAWKGFRRLPSTFDASAPTGAPESSTRRPFSPSGDLATREDVDLVHPGRVRGDGAQRKGEVAGGAVRGRGPGAPGAGPGTVAAREREARCPGPHIRALPRRRESS